MYGYVGSSSQTVMFDYDKCNKVGTEIATNITNALTGAGARVVSEFVPDCSRGAILEVCGGYYFWTLKGLDIDKISALTSQWAASMVVNGGANCGTKSPGTLINYSATFNNENSRYNCLSASASQSHVCL
jgi:hypothetical protein